MNEATFDIETDGLLDTVTTVWCLSIYEHSSGNVLCYGPDAIVEGLHQLLQYDCIIGHNIIGFDLPVLRRLYGWQPSGRVKDTLLMSRIQRPNRKLPVRLRMKAPPRPGPHSVEAWGERLGIQKVEHEDWTQFSPAMLERNRTDVVIQRQIYDALQQEAEGEDWARAHYLTSRLFTYLQLQEETGFPVDVEHMHRCCHILNRWIERIDRATLPHLPLVVDDEGPVNKPFLKNGDLAAITLRWDGPHDAVGGPFTRINIRPVNLNSNSETKQFLLDSGWEPLEWNYHGTTGERTSPKLSKDDVFHGISSSLGRIIARRVQCRHRLSQVEGLLEVVRDGRLSSVVTGVAVTGRAKHGVIVNIPGAQSFFGKWMRRIFIPEPGWVLVGCDSKGNQIRQLAARMGDEAFTEAVLFGNQEEGTDMHSVNQRRASLPSRTIAKNFIYGFMFGAGDAKLGKIVGGTREEGARYRAQFLREMPGLANLIETLKRDFRHTAKKRPGKWGGIEYSDGWITGLDGRPIFVTSEHQLLVYLLQSDEAIHMATAYCMFNHKADKLYTRGKDWNMYIWYHDEWQFGCRPEIAEELGQLSSDCIREAGKYLGIECPHEGDYHIGSNWALTH